MLCICIGVSVTNVLNEVAVMSTHFNRLNAISSFLAKVSFLFSISCDFFLYITWFSFSFNLTLSLSLVYLPTLFFCNLHFSVLKFEIEKQEYQTSRKSLVLIL